MRKLWPRLALALLGLACQAAPVEASCVLGKVGELPVTMVGLLPTIPVKINGVDLTMAADSGASFSLLTPKAAAKAKLRPGPLPSFSRVTPLTLPSPHGASEADLGPDTLWYGSGLIGGLGGQEHAGMATARDFMISGVKFHYAEFIVAAPHLSGRLDGLIGNNFLSSADVEFDLDNGVIRLFKPRDCREQDVLAYWAAPDKVSSVWIQAAAAPNFEILAHVKVNGHDMRAILDTGAGQSFITRAAAKSAGVAVSDNGVQPTGAGGGIGDNVYKTWIARFQSLQIGNEVATNVRLRIGDSELDDADVLIGADFLLSHRVYVANSQHKLYFTDIGRPVFNLKQAGGPGPASQPAPSPPDAGPSITGAPSDNLPR
jgi:predicted aspartyl protease